MTRRNSDWAVYARGGHHRLSIASGFGRTVRAGMAAATAAICLSAAADPVLRVVAAGETNLIRNGDFELARDASFSFWTAAPEGYRVESGEGRDGSQALFCEAPDESGWRGASQTLTLNRQTAVPLVVSGWSMAEAVTGGRDSGYSIYVDLIYADDTPLWGRTANFTTGTHDWERREVLITPEKPVKSLTVYCLVRGHGGRVWFDNVAVNEMAVTGEAVLFQGTPMELAADLPVPAGEAHVHQTENGLQLTLIGQAVTGLRIDGRELASHFAGGFLARDVAANSDVFGFEDGHCPELGLNLEASVTARPNHLVVEGRLSDRRGADRAMLLLFALPLDAAGWTWGDDIREDRTLQGSGEFANLNSVGCGTTGTLSAYPLAAIHDDQTGLALALDMGKPAQFRLVYHAGTRQFFIAYDFGLAPDTERFPGAAEFRFVLFRFDPAWGFRAAYETLMEIFPEYYAVRSREQGIWMPFTDVSTVQGWEDFGFRYHEGNNNVGWDDAHGILSFRYTEPMTWWMPMSPDLPRTEAEALRVRDAYTSGPAGNQQRMATVSRAAAMFEANGHPALIFRNEPWANGAVWSLNPNPLLPASPNAATVHWNEETQSRFYGPSTEEKLDGEYLDSLEGYVTAELNFRREHFPYSTVPLTFATDTRQLALWKGLAIWEFTRWISEEVHGLGGLMFANGVPYRFGFLCPWLDVLGTETNWLPGGTYQPVSAARLRYWRTMAGRKPYLLLMNTDYERFTPEFVERYFQRSLFYGFYPSMFSHNAAENPYWRNPSWYNRDRALFKKYIPLIKQTAEAGWQPVTSAVCDNPNILIERFGPDADGVVFFTLLNESPRDETVVLRVVPRATERPLPGAATELLSDRRLPPAENGWSIPLAAGATAVVRVEPGPRLIQAEATPAGRLRLTIESPVGLEQMLESSRDLSNWLAVDSRIPNASPFTFEVTMASDPGGRFFRLRW